MQTLTLSADSFDQVTTFLIDVGSRTPLKACLKCGYDKRDDGIFWALQKSAMLKQQYSEADHAERARLASSTPLRHGDLVLIDGQQYRVRVLGKFSNCAIFDPIA